MAYKRTGLIDRDLTDTEEEEFRAWSRTTENQADIRRRIEDGSISIYHPVIRDEFRKITGEACP
jgi:predicted GNAT family acetyltransferase